MKRGSFLLGLAAIFVLGILGGCATAPVPGARASLGTRHGPFSYEPLNVQNSCFVESVHLYDTYLKHYRNESPWIRVLCWGNEEGDFKVSEGHAVAVFLIKNRLWEYDINFGFSPLAVPPERRGDIGDVSPPVFAKYPKSREIFVRYRDDFPQEAPKQRPEFLFYHANRDVREATRVASELGRVRPVRVIEFNYPQNGKSQPSAATIFLFGSQLCVYFPRHGTHLSRANFEGIDNLNTITYVVKRLFPKATDVRWQAGGYWLFPPKK